MGFISDCKRQCSHYWICKIKETYQKFAMSNISIDVPEFCKADIDLLCRHQLQPKYDNNAPKYRAIDDRCDECKHKEVCLNKDGYQKLIEGLANSEVKFSIHCPYLSLETKDEINGEVK